MFFFFVEVEAPKTRVVDFTLPYLVIYPIIQLMNKIIKILNIDKNKTKMFTSL